MAAAPDPTAHDEHQEENVTTTDTTRPTTARKTKTGTKSRKTRTKTSRRRATVCGPRREPLLAEYDLIVLNYSGGKDSNAAADVVMEQARAEGVTDRVVMVYADLGEMAWAGTKELAVEHAAHYGVRLEVVARRHKLTGLVETILERVAARGLWPDAGRRWCTSDHKRGPVLKLITSLVKELRDSGRAIGRPARVLQVFGFRAQESKARAARTRYAPDRRASNGRRDVDVWLPIHGWTVEQVWTRIRAAGTRPHPAYAAGMTRLSCVFCVLASRADLITAVRLNPELAERYAQVEETTGHRFRQDLSMRQVIALAAAEVPAEPDQDHGQPGCPALLALFAEPAKTRVVKRRRAALRRRGTGTPPPVRPNPAGLFAEPAPNGRTATPAHAG